MPAFWLCTFFVMPTLGGISLGHRTLGYWQAARQANEMPPNVGMTNWKSWKKRRIKLLTLVRVWLKRVSLTHGRYKRLAPASALQTRTNVG
jgi:hypothetical protein